MIDYSKLTQCECEEFIYNKSQCSLCTMRKDLLALRAITAEYVEQCESWKRIAKDLKDQLMNLSEAHEAAQYYKEKLDLAMVVLERLKTVCAIPGGSLNREGIKKHVQEALSQIRGEK